MGKITRGYLKQDFEINLDVEKLADYIASKIVEAIESEKTEDKQTFTDVEVDESYFEGGELVITGSYETAYENWYCRATLESPEENETNYEGIEGWGDGILCTLPQELKELVSVSKIRASEDMTTPCHLYDPDDYYED